MRTLRRRLPALLVALAATFALAACEGDGADTGAEPVDEGIEIEDGAGGDAEGNEEPLGADDADGVTDEGEDGGEDAEG